MATATALEITTQEQAQEILDKVISDNWESSRVGLPQIMAALQAAKTNGWAVDVGKASLSIAKHGSAEQIEQFSQLGYEFSDCAENGRDAAYYIARRPNDSRLKAYLTAKGRFNPETVYPDGLDVGLLLALKARPEYLNFLAESGFTNIFTGRTLPDSKSDLYGKIAEGSDAGVVIASRMDADLITAFHKVGGKFTDCTNALGQDAGFFIAAAKVSFKEPLIQAFVEAGGRFTNRTSYNQSDGRPDTRFPTNDGYQLLSEKGTVDAKAIEAFAKGGGVFCDTIHGGFSAGFLAVSLHREPEIRAFVDAGGRFTQPHKILNSVIDRISKGDLPLNILDLVVQNTPNMPDMHSSVGQQLRNTAFQELNVDLYKIPRAVSSPNAIMVPASVLNGTSSTLLLNSGDGTILMLLGGNGGNHR